MDTPSNEQYLATAIHYLIQGQEFDEANLLLLCRAEAKIYSRTGDNYYVNLIGPREVYEALLMREGSYPRLYWTVYNALAAIRIDDRTLHELRVFTDLIDIDTSETSDWRAELREVIKSGGISNQGRELPERKVVIWKGLRFRSEAERLVAIALDKKGVLFLPNCAARLTLKEAADTRTGEAERDTREPDFLVCHKGKWGILEVDGPYHEGRAAHDHERDAAFHKQGIRVIQHYTAERCMSDSANVIREFLGLLETNG
jgi:hypothetical protein